MSAFRNTDVNPCLEESAASTKCMNVNNYQKEMCTSYFIRYKQCRKFWHTIMLNRRRDGVSPAMPTAEERKQILASLGSVPY
ncbi:PREDICTED: coiled-coil-helix-coiled-coil-helix domain-containing protein 7 [Nanorana parkeri]|uniref:coiled-coil-helix-coiled-coil-helix domain-containing protein 7 n=1 Tax=Nanorana parkeri TaxID=125878 RepID=UPI0008544C82|nr:PREDICTED: coiled-coil-helix-coiled-coil-helix domain-containing protein 7 [Nanorana parkeri]